MKQFFVILLLFSLSSCHKKKEQKKPRVESVAVAKAVKQDAPIYIDSVGNVDPIITVNVVSRVQGEITGVYFNEGDVVKEGDLLFTIDPRTFQAELDKSIGTLEETLANLDFAREKVLRYAALTEEEYYSQINFDELTTNVAALEAQVKKYQGEVDDAQVNLDYCWIYSTMHGRTGILQVDKGNTIKGVEGELLITINQIKPIYVTFFIPEREVPRVRKYMKKNGPLETIVAFEDFDKDAFHGKLQMIDNQIDENTGMIYLRSIFENDEEDLWPGEYVRTRLILYIQRDATLIPFQAITRTSTDTFVYVVKKNNTVEMRKVTLGQRQDDNIIVEKGIEPGETVVIEGMQNLKPGSHVSVKEKVS